MKSLFLLILLSSCFFNKTNAQTRYLDDTYFSSVEIDTGILYGNNDTYLNVNQNLYLDFYEPSGDVLTERPLIIWIHGGGYTSGTRQDSIMLLWCNEFARRGYITASIDYRLGISNPFTGKTEAIYRSVQDAKAAIRYFRQNATSYKVDTSKIVVAGSSVGSFTAIHTAYWDQDEVPSTIDTLTMDNLEGLSGNPGFSTKVHAVINFWGAIKDSTWIDAGEPMIVSCAGVEDSVVYPEMHTYNSGPEYGSIVIDRVAKSLNIPDTLRMFVGAKHTLAGGSGSEQHLRFDTASYFAAEFLYCNLIQNCNSNALFEKQKETDIRIYPNPVNDKFILETNTEIEKNLVIYNNLGLEVRKINNEGKGTKIEIDISTLPKGIYFIETEFFRHKIIKI